MSAHRARRARSQRGLGLAAMMLALLVLATSVLSVATLTGDGVSAGSRFDISGEAVDAELEALAAMDWPEPAAGVPLDDPGSLTRETKSMSIEAEETCREADEFDELLGIEKGTEVCSAPARDQSPDLLDAPLFKVADGMVAAEIPEPDSGRLEEPEDELDEVPGEGTEEPGGETGEEAEVEPDEEPETGTEPDEELEDGSEGEGASGEGPEASVQGASASYTVSGATEPGPGEYLSPNWVQVTPLAQPEVVVEAAMVHDPVRGNTVLFGGRAADGSYSDETWIWTGSNWVQADPDVVPLRRSRAAMAWDLTANTYVYVNGNPLNMWDPDGHWPKWVKDAKDWTKEKLKDGKEWGEEKGKSLLQTIGETFPRNLPEARQQIGAGFALAGAGMADLGVLIAQHKAPHADIPDINAREKLNKALVDRGIQTNSLLTFVTENAVPFVIPYVGHAIRGALLLRTTLRINQAARATTTPAVRTTPKTNPGTKPQPNPNITPGSKPTNTKTSTTGTPTPAAKSVRPSVTDPRLGRTLADDFRGGPNPIGDGSALDAARHTVDTGRLVGGSTHLEKAVEMRDRYARVLRRGGLSSADEAVAQGRFDAYRSFVVENDLDAMMRARGLR